MPRQRLPAPPSAPRREATHGLARILSKRGFCSRRNAEALVREGRVRLDGRIERDPESRTRPDARIEVDGRTVEAARRHYLMLNKPRGLVTTASDPQGRDTVYRCLDGLSLPHLAPVGRLDKASEGLLLFTNHTEWADRVLDGPHAPDKTYDVQVAGQPDEALLVHLARGVEDRGEHLSARSVTLLRAGTQNAWLRFVLTEGRNRHIRRLLAAFDMETLRLVRVAIGPVQLGDLPKGDVRPLSTEEVASLAAPDP